MVKSLSISELSPTAKFGYIPGLDGLRALAVLLVIFCHVGYSHIIPGGFGVTVFFFISGFLITRLLIAEIGKQGNIGLSNFYIRRFLRLLPALYVMLIATIAALSYLGNPPNNLEMATAFTYTMNYHYAWLAFTGQPQEGPWGHLWSLGVEEHFYLLFPLMLGFFRHRLNTAIKVCIGVCVFALSWRLIAYYGLEFPGKYNYVATETRLDSIVYGSLFSLLLHCKPDASWLKKLVGLVPLGLATLVLLFCFIYRDDGFRETFRYSLQGGALFVGMLNLYFLPKLGFAIQLLENRLLVWIGRISYGLYLWHIPVALYLDQYTQLEIGSFSFVVMALILTFGLTSLSFYFVERPIIGLRRKFGSHQKKPEPRQPRSAPVAPATIVGNAE